MKKTTLLFLTALTTSLLTGCGTPPASALGFGMYYGNAAGMSADAEDSTNNAGGRSIRANKTGTAEGHIGDTMSTCFFDFTVNNFHTCGQYENYLPAEGNMLMVVDITVKNILDEDIPMYDSDFQVQWNDPSEDAWRAPVTCSWYMDPPVFIGEDVLPAEYTLTPGESRSGLLIFEIPLDSSDFNFSYLETFSYADEEDVLLDGDVFFVYFHDAESCTQKHFGCIIDNSWAQAETADIEWYVGNQNAELPFDGKESSLYNTAGRIISAEISGSAEGHIGDTMLTYFFDFTINKFDFCSQYENYVPADGYMLAVAEIAIKNTFDEAIPMFDTDFMIHWNDGMDNFQYPITWYMGPSSSVGENVLPYEYSLAADEIRTGLLIFEIPSGSENLSIHYREEFDDDTVGDVFSIYVHDAENCMENHSGYILRDSQDSADDLDKI